MKKLLKIFTLIIFILLVFGITTSQAALTVGTGTSASEMVTELNKNGGYLTGISNTVRKGNPYLYCRQHNQHISGSAQYYFKNSVTYPSGDSTNGYAKAYILAASGYGNNTSNGLRQYAWWQILGQESGTNELLTIARKYQTHKQSEQNVAVNYNSAATSVSGNTLIYGPIKVTYSYNSETSGSYSDEWGGFDYAFFNGNTAITNGVTLCTLNNGSYTAITTSGINGGYNKVRTSSYNNVNLYVKVDLSKVTNIGAINLKIKENKVNYSATIYEIAGSYKVQTTKTVYCTVCESELDKANTSDHTLYIAKMSLWSSQDFSNKLNLGDIYNIHYPYIGKNYNNYFKYVGRELEFYERDTTYLDKIYLGDISFTTNEYNRIYGYEEYRQRRYNIL